MYTYKDDFENKKLETSLKQVFVRYFNRGGKTSGSKLTEATYQAMKEAAFEHAGDNAALAASLMGTLEGYVKCSMELKGNRNGNC